MLKGLAGLGARRAGMIAKTYKFKNYFETMAFVNAAAWVSHREDHHPDMLVGYNQCRVATSRTRSTGCRRTTSSARPSSTRCSRSDALAR